MDNIATFDFRAINGIPIVTATGEIDLSNVDKLDAILQQATVTPVAAVILSLERVSYWGSTGFHALEKWSRRLDGAARLLVVKPATLGRIFRLVHLNGAIQTFDSMEAATERAIQMSDGGPN